MILLSTLLITLFVKQATTATDNETVLPVHSFRGTTNDCLKMRFEESYVVEFGNENFKIVPIIEEVCQKCYFYGFGYFSEE